MSRVFSSGIAISSRYSAGGVDPFTAVVGQTICRSFAPGRQGEQRVRSTIKSLPSHDSVGNIVHFGFRADGIVRNLSSTYEGAVLTAITASAVECYKNDHAVDILWEMAQLYRTDTAEDMTPSPIQWKVLVKQCSGVLSGSEVPRNR